MAMPDEFSVYCGHCSQYNLVDIWCGDCVDRKIEGLEADLATAQAQVAEMAVALEKIAGMNYDARTSTIAQEALPAALKVVWATDLAELVVEDGEFGKEFWVDLGPLDYFGPIIVPPSMKGGEQLNIIVLDKGEGE